MKELNFDIDIEILKKDWYMLNDKWNKEYIDMENDIKLFNENIINENHNIETDENDIPLNNIEETIDNNNAYETPKDFLLDDEQTVNEILQKEITLNKKYNDNFIIEIVKDLNTLINYIYNIGYNKALVYKKLELLKHIAMTLSYLIMLLNIPKLIRRDDYSLNTSSYKFCQKGINCNQQYPDIIDYKISCNFTHYHFNLLLVDVEKIISYLTSNLNNSKLKNISDLFSLNLDEPNYLKCIQTLKYVINNINRELSSVTTYYKAPITYILRKARRRN